MAKKRDVSGLDQHQENEISSSGINYLFTIGIDEYQHCPKLHNAVKDARDVTKILFDKYNFESKHHFKLENKEATKDNIIDAFRKIKNTIHPSDNLLIYYSGHGELDRDFDESYWVTIDSRKGRTGDYLPLDSLIKYVKAIKTHHTLLIIDACFAGAALVNRRSSTQALERDPSRYVIASGRKEFASDGESGKNSPFAQALIEKLKHTEESLLATDLGQYVMKQTIKATRQTQRPIHNPLMIPEDKGGQFVFHPKTSSEDSIWASTLKTNTLTAFRAYLKRYPKGTYIEEAFWQIAVISNTELAYDDYLEHFPNGRYASEAEQKMNDLEEEAAWKDALRRDTLTGYRSYTRRYRRGKYRKEAFERINSIKEAEKEIASQNDPSKESNEPKKSPERIITPPQIIESPDTFFDPRNGQEYKTVKLKDGKIWMAQNLNFDVGEGCWFYDEDPKNGEKYGRLYTWEAFMKACPPGWRLPSDAEWRTMAKYYGGYSGDASDGGKAAYQALIDGGNSSFSALLGGRRYSDGSFSSLGSSGYYWSSTEHDAAKAWIYYFRQPSSKLRRSYGYKRWGFSCRCIQDD